MISPRGPVAGARYTVRPDTGSPVAPVPLDQGVTGPTGELETEVPESTIALVVVVIPPGGAAKVERSPLRGSGEVTVPVPEQGGALVIRARAWDATRPVHLFSGAAWTPITSLRARARTRPLEDGRLEWRLRGMAPGSYRLCRGIRVTQECDGGRLAAGGELILEIP